MDTNKNWNLDIDDDDDEVNTEDWNVIDSVPWICRIADKLEFWDGRVIEDFFDDDLRTQKENEEKS